MTAKRTNALIGALIGVSLAGIAISVYQSAMFYQIRGGTAGFKSACNLGQQANCDVIMASKYAELFWGIPLSSAAAGWFLGLFILGFVAKNPFWRRDALRVALAMSAFAGVMGLVFLGIMIGVLHTFCIFCLGVDLCTFVILGLMVSLKSEWSSPIKPEAPKMKALVATALGALVVGAGLLKTLDPVASLPSDLDDRLKEVLASPVLAVGAGDEFPSFGPKDATVTIVEFSDFQCPYCRLGAMFLNSVLNRYPKDVRVVFRAYPLDPSCNGSVKHSMHPVACQAARVAMCSRKQGKFKDVYETFFEHQAEFSTEGKGQPEQLAAKAGADLAGIQACETQPDISLAVAKDIEEGDRLGVQSTPTFFVNGHKLEGLLPVPGWNALVEKILAGAGK
jgi:protein-disulfide isomerase